ncbi:hypothetical protein [Ottowia sp. SB7-C50]|uniref:hypothetical protein n=1 Tax=Ottowia sp. SB7-C50 TaxID=3081231 RepID=UPI002953A5FC|nr:hypothetical protein [Ottowia sp. SB7-C50]WOP15811.1 hypothetical protein R0D99_01675 [Ottowia sp. SB7-C50]
MSNRKQMFVLSGLFAAVALSLTACGGGGDSSTTPAPAPGSTLNPGTGVSDGATPTAPVTLSGQVTRAGPLKNVVVCLDLNANNACDAGEPASAATGADGAYSLTFDSTKVTGAAAASLIAPVKPGAVTDPATVIDMGYKPDTAATTNAYVLKRVAGSGGAINPLTTLVAAGVAGGMTEAVARANVVTQLAITDAKIDNYQDDPAADDSNIQDTARFMAQVTSRVLREGGTLHVADQAAAIAAAPGALNLLAFTDAGNYRYHTLDIQAKPAGTLGRLVTDVRSGKTNGVATARTVLYSQAYLSPSGWVLCDDTVPILASEGNPSRSLSCNTRPQVGFSTPDVNVAGKAMADVVAQSQSDATSNLINNGTGSTPNLLAALGNAQFPAGSTLTKRTNYGLAPSIYINNVYGDTYSVDYARKLEDLIAKAAVGNINLGTGNGGTLSLGPAGDGGQRNMRVAFIASASPTSGTAQFYECTYNAALTDASNCQPTTQGTYAISTVNGVRIMRFSGHPAVTATNYTRIFAEFKSSTTGDRVYFARELKTDLANVLNYSNRLNATAWAAMKSQLGI